MAHPEVAIDYTSGSSADTASFSVSAPARWIQVYGGGTITVLDCSGTNNVGVSRTYTVVGGEVIQGEWQSFTSTTCSRVRLGTSATPPVTAPAAVLPLNLAGGPTTLYGILPAGNVQDWVDAGTVQTAPFTATVNWLIPYNMQTASVVISFPKISAALNGLSVGLVNQGTGATTTILTPSGTDSFGPVAVGVTGATAAGPASLKAIRYTPNLTTGQWIPNV